MKSSASSLYVHIPFCKSICSYCDFKKFIYNQTRVDNYFESLFFELEKYNKKYKTIYIGGGTPSAIDSNNLEKLLAILSNKLSDNYQEFAIENNVEDINEDYLKLLAKYKINRLSIGVQTFNPKYISLCNRHHTKDMVIKRINLAKKYFNNVSIDMIFGYPNQTKKELDKDLELATSLPITHISYYSLLIEPNTILNAKGYKDMDDNTQAKLYTYIYKYLAKKGFNRYEISNFAKAKKYQSHHNKVYWHNKHYDAVGLAASGYINNIRFTNNTNIISYNNKDYTLSEKTILSKEDIMFDEIMMNMRLDEGLNITKFDKKFKTNFKEKYKDAIKTNKNLKLITIKNNVMKTNFKGSLLLNSVLEEFL